MVYFCADDYGLSTCCNGRIENCLENGVLNKVSAIPNGEISDLKNRLTKYGAALSLHINLVEGRPVSDPEEVSLLLSDDGYFRCSFIGLLLLSLSPKRKKFEKQVYAEIKNQIEVWKETVGENVPISIDGHQHTHMIPLIFKTLVRVIKDTGTEVRSVRIPAEPLTPYLFTPSLFFYYSPTGLIKQWLLKFLAFVNRNEFRKLNIQSAYFMGAMFSGKLSEAKIKKTLPRYLKLAEKNNKDVEIGFHPGYTESGESLIEGSRRDFKKFYFSPWRKIEYDTLMNFRF